MQQLAAKDPSWALADNCDQIFCLVHGAKRAEWCCTCKKTTEALGVRALTFGTGGGHGRPRVSSGDRGGDGSSASASSSAGLTMMGTRAALHPGVDTVQP